MGLLSSKTNNPEDGGHAWASSSGRFMIDQLLRKEGWEIFGRPRVGHVRWRHRVTKEIKAQEAIVKGWPADKVANAQREHDRYLEDKYQ